MILRIKNQSSLVIVNKEMIDQKWKDVIEAELDSLVKRKVFGPIVHTPKGVK